MRDSWYDDHFDALESTGSIHSLRALAWILALMLVATVVALALVPWQQAVPASGQVVAFDPVQRRQFVEAPLDGRIVRWAIVEGARVRKSDVLLEISDNDPALVERMQTERDATEGVRQASLRKAESLRLKVERLELTKDRSVAAAESRIKVAEDQVAAAARALEAAEAAERTADLNLERQLLLNQRGLSSRRNLELAQLRGDQTVAAANKARAELNAARNSRIVAQAERERAEADGQAKVDDAAASLQQALSDERKAAGELVKIDVRLARQATQLVQAPIDGFVLRVLARQGAEMVKAGDVLMELVPDSGHNVVELWVDGNDAPLVSPGRKVRLQFEGWPALQFIGWPSIAVGTFGGEVLVVDASDNGRGEFRALVQPDPASPSWPEQRYLRQGVRANGWILLDRVSLGFEIWRQFNGFPPATTAPGADLQAAGKKA
ncbi:MAG: HlyD family efflux transporter periplasmic adaptor subunit [Bryobacterales bacterium]|nr:HlyD family efflux transporter periplasmic adaptor subunit [Bryobacterales bacterium]